MARIQILELPTEVAGEDVTTPFAVIIDQTSGEKVDPEAWTAFGQKVGARAVAVFSETVEVKN
jgi:hypothetical protein